MRRYKLRNEKRGNVWGAFTLIDRCLSLSQSAVHLSPAHSASLGLNYWKPVKTKTDTQGNVLNIYRLMTEGQRRGFTMTDRV